MTIAMSRRAVLASGAAVLAAGTTGAARAQTRPTLRFSAVFTEQDTRAQMMQRFSAAVANDFTMQLFYGGNLFRQGTELVALQRGNLEMGNIAPQDVSNQVPAWTIMTAAYLFRDADHLQKVFASDVGQQMKTMAEDQLGIRILAPTYFGTRHVSLRGRRRVNTPADLAGVKLRMPGGDAWQFLGQALGANPVPMAFAEVYTGLQTGAIDGQDNPLPNVQTMKFHEVSNQIVLTGHLVGYDLLTVSARVWRAMSAERQSAFQAAADAAVAWSNAEHARREAELVDFFKGQGLDVYTPDIAAFREHAQRRYLASDLARSWPQGMIERINAL